MADSSIADGQGYGIWRFKEATDASQSLLFDNVSQLSYVTEHLMK